MTTEREAEYIFYMACAVVGKVNVPFPNVRPDWQKIYEISAYHRIENIVAYAVEQLCLNKEYCEQIPDEVKKQFQKARLSGIMRETIQYHEYEKLTNRFSIYVTKISFLDSEKEADDANRIVTIRFSNLWEMKWHKKS